MRGVAKRMLSEQYFKNADGLEISEDGTRVRLDIERFEENEDYAAKIIDELDSSPRRQEIPVLVGFEEQLTKAEEKFLSQIKTTLETQVQTGLFKKSGFDDCGVACLHHFSFAVGMSAFQSQNKYRKHFKENFGHDIPDWVGHLHPQHIRLLCELALENLMPLPEIWPRDETC